MHQTQYMARLRRVKDAIALKEPDRVPCVPFCNSYYASFAGYTVADILYDVEKAKDAALRYMRHYEPDLAISIGHLHAGTGPLKEKLGIRWLQWAGGPGKSVDVNSMHQYIEKPYMHEDDYPELLGDLTGWLLKKFLPQGYRVMEPLQKLDFYNMRGMDICFQCIPFADPEVQRSFRILGEVGAGAERLLAEYAELDRELVELGFPLQFTALATAPFDQLSDNLRGTLDLMIDMYEQPEQVHAVTEKFMHRTISDVCDAQKPSPDAANLVFMPLHKGMDGFMSDAQYRSFYWDTLLRVVNAYIDAGLTPWLYTEGPYDSRVECLMDLPRGKSFIHFEQADMLRAKRLLGKVACLSGGISSSMLVYGTPEQVIEKTKENIDILAPGGGFIFDLSDTMETTARPENVEAMFETVKTYGQY